MDCKGATRYYINNSWLFSREFKQEMLQADYTADDMISVRLPHTCKELPYHYFDEHLYQMVSGYCRLLQVPAEWEGRRILLTFEGVGHDCQVYINGTVAGEHHCGYTAFTLDISDYLRYGGENLLTVKVDSRENLNIPPFGFVIDYMTYGGIYREVYLEVKNPVYIEDAYIHSEIDFTKQATLITDLTIKGVGHLPDDCVIRQWIRRRGEEEFALLAENTSAKWKENSNGRKDLAPMTDIAEAQDNATTQFRMQVSLPQVALWDTENPILYEIKTQLLCNNEILDEKSIIHGFRKAEFRKDGFYLNERKLKIRGLNRHQSYPYVGYAMPKSMQVADADILKYELGLNAVRTSHYPQSHYFLDRCDELGLLVFTEFPGWQHIGDEAWKAQAVENVRDMVVQYRNHPSIILWGVRINESVDDDEFYARTNAAARSLDPYRATGGVRAHKKSSLLEDVYTYNDFSHEGKNPGCDPKHKVTSNPEKAYLVSEYNGHMFPTKAFDWEERRMEHAIRHANVLDAVAGEGDIAGSFGWCMADYNTHKDFGSGDRICYHGVMDMFRNPKMAADVYAMQQDDRPVLTLSSSMDIGEHPGTNRGDTWIFTNADSVRMYKNRRFIREFKATDSPYKNLAHGPILIDDFIGDALLEEKDFTPKQAVQIKEALNYVARFGLSKLPLKYVLTAFKMIVFHHMKPERAVELYERHIGDWGGESTTYRFEAIKDGKVVREIKKQPMTSIQLQATASHSILKESTAYDVASIRIRMVDENGNQLPFYQEPVELSVEGPIELIGPSIISLKGGMGGTYIKTTGRAGEAVLTIRSGQAEVLKLEFEVETPEGSDRMD